MRYVFSLLFAAALTASGASIEISASATHPLGEFWYEITNVMYPPYPGDAQTNRRASWDRSLFGDTLRIPYTLEFPALELPAEAVVTDIRISMQYPYMHFRVPQTYTQQVEPIRADCDGVPCPYSATNHYGMGLNVWAPVGDYFGNPPDLDQLRAGFVLEGYWEIWFGEVTAGLTSPGENSITVSRWSSTFVPFHQSAITVDYDIPASAVPEPAAFFVGGAGLLTLAYLRRIRRWSSTHRATAAPQSLRR